MQLKKTVAIFDFDGTITKGDTFIPFLYHCFKGWKFFVGLIYTAPFVIAYFFKLISNEYAKKKMILFFLKGEDISKISLQSEIFIEELCNKHYRDNIIERLLWHQKNNHTTILISASLDIYIKPWAKKFNFTFAEATELEKINGKYSGNIIGKNCYGLEKVNRMKKILGDDIKSYNIYGYGDSKGDDFFLDLCDHKYPKNKLKHV